MLTREDILRRSLFIVPDSKEALHRWIKVYLDLDLPSSMICDDDINNSPTNSCPMDFVSEAFFKAVKGDDKNFTSVLVYAARGCFKTLTASILEFLFIVLLERDSAHMAALEDQAAESQRYVNGFFNKNPILAEFLTSKNKRTIEMTRYVHLKEPDFIISPVQYKQLTDAEQLKFTEKKNTIEIMIGTVEAAN